MNKSRTNEIRNEITT